MSNLTELDEVQVDELVYVQHADRSMMLRLFRPRTAGPYPIVIDLHGGAWNRGSIDDCTDRGVALARAGIAAAALDFRHAEDGYPTSLIDINYAIRWLKGNARNLDVDPARVGLSGQSSGGHLAMLVAMRPGDARYSAIETATSMGQEASVQCVCMTWPVINPISRYRYALRLLEQAQPPTWIGDIPQRHDTYWGDEAAMIEGNPMLALERGEGVQTPNACWIQGRPDPVHDYRDESSEVELNEPERFVQRYREAGGRIDLIDIEQTNRARESIARWSVFSSNSLIKARASRGIWHVYDAVASVVSKLC